MKALDDPAPGAGPRMVFGDGRPVTFVCGGRNVPSARFRVDPVAAGLRAGGWDPTVVYGYGTLDRAIPAGLLQKSYRALCRVRRSAKTALLPRGIPAVLQRLALPWNDWAERIAASRGVGFIADFDDAIFLAADGSASALRSRALTRVLDAAEHVVAGNAWLASFVADAGKVTVLPTCIDVAAYIPARRPPATRPVVGWMGTGGNLKYLARLAQPLSRLRREGVDFRLVIVSDTDDRALRRALGAEFIRWSAAEELPLLQSFDIGLMPLADDDWCRGKCGFKLIQYMAVGAAVAGSAVGFNRDVVRDGTDGFLVDDAGWFEALRTLVTDADARRGMADAGRRRVEANFAIERATATYDRLLRTLQ